MDFGQIIDNLRKGFYSPFIAKILRLYYIFQRGKGKKVVEDDWDYLIVLDSCRYETFEKYHDFEGDLSAVRSKGGHSKEWLKRNFTDYYEDIAYISGNVFVSPNQKGGFNSSNHFAKIYPVYLNDEAQERGVTHPKYMVEEALRAEEEFPEKRKIIHFMQPHTPYLGDYQIREDNGETLGDLKRRGISDSEIRKAYISNFKFVQRYVKNLINELSGKIVITADHGEALGEKGLYNHHPGAYTEELVKVPWLEIEKGEKKEKELNGIDF